MVVSLIIIQSLWAKFRTREYTVMVSYINLINSFYFSFIVYLFSFHRTRVKLVNSHLHYIGIREMFAHYWRSESLNFDNFIIIMHVLYSLLSTQ